MGAKGVVYIASRLVVDAGTTFAPGALAVVDGIILLAGPRDDILRAAPASFPRFEFPGAVLLPGLVNAHTHLQIPRFTGPGGEPLPIPPSFVDWILRVIAWKRGATPESFQSNFARAAEEALSFGTTTVGEIAGPDAGVYASCPLRARVFAEGIGFDPKVASQVLGIVEETVRLLGETAASNPLVLPGVSPHTLYTVGEDLLRALSAFSAGRDLPVCLHLAESPAEAAFLSEGGGEIATRLYPAVGKDVSGFHGLGRTIPAYLGGTGLLREGVMLVHNVHLPNPEIDALREGGARFVLCPRSNLAHGNGVPDVGHFIDSRIPFALGTDSLGSVSDLSPWEELRVARGLYGGRKRDGELCRDLFRAATENGSAALGLSGGILAPGMPADVAIVDDPGGDGGRFFKGLIGKTGRANVRLTVVAGRAAHGAAS